MTNLYKCTRGHTAAWSYTEVTRSYEELREEGKELHGGVMEEIMDKVMINPYVSRLSRELDILNSKWFHYAMEDEKKYTMEQITTNPFPGKSI